MKIRSKYYSLVLYPNEDLSHKKCLDYIVNHFDYALIKHDKDLDSDLKLKKEHYHVVIAFENYRWLDSVINDLSIKSNYIEKSNSLESALKYLIHYNNKDKFQYDLSEVSGILKNKLENFVYRDKHNSENSESLLILELIEESSYITLSNFIKVICENDLYSTFRRNYICFKDLIHEHNINFKKNE